MEPNKLCQHCESPRLLDVTGKTSDCCICTLKGYEHDGYVPADAGIGGSDCISITVCLECGQLQGEWPIPNPDFVPTPPGDEDETTM